MGIFQAHRRLFPFSLILMSALFLSAVNSYAQTDPSKLQLKRKGLFMGFDPGLAWRFEDDGESLYTRMTLRVGGCFNERAQLGVDWRMEVMVAGAADPSLNRHEIGPVATFFLKKGWFLRPHVHINNLLPVVLATGLATGYEWGTGRFSGVGFSVGGDTAVGFDGSPPAGWSVFMSFYLTAYDLKTRRGREPL